jgi:FkbH-like protein
VSGLTAVEWLERQDVLFADRLNRFALMKLGAPGSAPRTLRVLRNHAFEGVASALAPFLDYADIPMMVRIGDYDDSLQISSGDADATLVWQDFSRYPKLANDELAQWIVHRLDEVRARSRGPVIAAAAADAGQRYASVNLALDAWAARTPSAAILKLDAIAVELGPKAFDEARSGVTGTRLSDAAQLEAARTLAFEVLAGFLAEPVKALAVDLDNTLYSGVLGEDGPEAVSLTEFHAALQRAIGAWADRGMLVTVLSRNEPTDVEALFERRRDFPLRPHQVASWQVGWGRKSDAIAAAAAGFGIAPDSFLMIDDNLGELAEASSAFRGLRLLHAGSAETAVRALSHYPGLPRRGIAFAGRGADLAANVERQTLAREAVDEEAYLAALQAALTFRLNPPEDRARLAEISRKTNQFNLALARLDEVAVEQYLTAPDRCVVHVRLADRLTDSGSVAALFARREGEAMVVDELCISCRALGRRLEDVMIAEALRGAAEALGTTRAEFVYRTGPRNRPALAWLEGFSGGAGAEEGRAAAPAWALEPQVSPYITLNWDR